MFERKLTAGWGDMDFNSHMRNTAYLDKSADVRMMFFSENGFPELDYFREVGLLEEIRVTLEVVELSADGSRFLLQNTFYHSDGKLIARVRSKGGWLDLNARKLVAPPDKLLTAMRRAPRSDDFKEVPSSLKEDKS